MTYKADAYTYLGFATDRLNCPICSPTKLSIIEVSFKMVEIRPSHIVLYFSFIVHTYRHIVGKDFLVVLDRLSVCHRDSNLTKPLSWEILE